MAETAGIKFLLDPYLDWVKGEGVPVVEGHAVDLNKVETAPWARVGAKGAFVHLQGRGDFVALQIIEIPPGGQTSWQRHLYDDVFYVLSGHGSAVVEAAPGRSSSFEWGPHSLFSPPLNAPFRFFNGSGSQPARLVSGNNLPLLMNLFHSEAFVFGHPWYFDERAGKDGYFNGDGDFLALKPGSHMWETNFVPDLASFELPAWENRGTGSKNIKFILADSVMHAHTSEMAVGTYKKGHRHGPGAHVFAVSGTGYTLMWYEGDKGGDKGGDKDFIRHEWSHGFVFTPDDGMFHQHFNTSKQPARYLAISLGSHRYPMLTRKVTRKQNPEASVKEGGLQIDYEDQDPRIHAIWLRELAKTGVPSGMGHVFDEARILSEAS